MAYRDDLETRRAHVRRLEEQLAEVEHEEALVRSLPKGKQGLLARALGGPRVLERSFVVDGPIDDLRTLANETFGVDGRLDEEDGVMVWRAEPDPRPRRVEVRALENEDGTTLVTVSDKGSYRAYLVLLTVLAMSGQFARGAATSAILAVLMLVFAFFASRHARGTLVRLTRLRARQALALEEALAEREPVARVRVHTESADDAEVEERIEPPIPAMAETS